MSSRRLQATISSGRTGRGDEEGAWPSTSHQTFKLTYTAVTDDRFELLWVQTHIKTTHCFISALYHPPTTSKLSYTPFELVEHLRITLERIADRSGETVAILAGDFNQLSDADLSDLGLINAVSEPTHQGHMLDRIYSSEPMYLTSKVVQSAVPTAHKAIVARGDNSFIKDVNKTSTSVSFRKRTPARAASLLSELSHVDWSDFYCLSGTQPLFDYFYDLIVALLDKHYPVTSATVTTRDPPFVTPAIKVMLRRKNRLMRGGRLAEANVLAVRIGAAITKYNSAELSDLMNYLPHTLSTTQQARWC
jgi:hypothetical protein